LAICRPGEGCIVTKRPALALLLPIAVASGIVLLTRPSAEADPATFTVDSTGDGSNNSTTDGVCDGGSGNCTQQANTDTGTDTIEFDISGDGSTLPPGGSEVLR
jgi:hypothetical protein